MAQLRKELKKWEEAEAAEKAKKAKPNNLDLNTYVVSRLLPDYMFPPRVLTASFDRRIIRLCSLV